LGVSNPTRLFQPDGSTVSIPDNAVYEDLLKPIFRKGSLVWEETPLVKARQFAADQLKAFPAEMRAHYPVGLDSQLERIKQKLIEENRAG